VTGAGDGSLTEILTVTVPPLTGLSAANEGVFLMLGVIHVIDGRQGLRGHDGPMPLWGRHFSRQAEFDDLWQYGNETVVRGRILSIAYCLGTLQE